MMIQGDLFMRRSVTFALLLCPAVAVAADPPKAVAPFLDDQAYAVARVDLSRIDPAAAVDKFTGLVPVADAEKAGTRQAVSEVRDRLTKAGVRDVFAVASLADFPASPGYLVVPL